MSKISSQSPVQSKGIANAVAMEEGWVSKRLGLGTTMRIDGKNVRLDSLPTAQKQEFRLCVDTQCGTYKLGDAVRIDDKLYNIALIGGKMHLFEKNVVLQDSFEDLGLSEAPPATNTTIRLLKGEVGDSCSSGDDADCYSNNCECDRNRLRCVCRKGTLAGGQQCQYSGREDECRRGFYCGASSGSAATCQAKKSASSACQNDYECESNACHRGLCTLKKAFNEPCSDNADCMSGACQAGKCRHGSRNVTAACTTVGHEAECRYGLYCDRSNPNQTPSCRNKKVAGNACSSNGECESNACVAGNCQRKLVLKEGCNFNSDCYSGSCAGVCARGGKIEDRACVHVGRDDEAGREGFYCGLNAEGNPVIKVKKSVLGDPCSFNGECSTHSCVNGACALGGNSSVMAVCLIINTSIISATDAQLEEAIAYTSDMLWDRTGVRLRAVRPVHRVNSTRGFTATPGESSAVDVCYTAHQSDPAHVVVAFSGAVSSLNNGHVIVSSSLRDQGYCNQFFSPMFGSDYIYGADISPNRRVNNATVPLDLSALSGRIILAQRLIHEFAHAFGSHGNNDHIASGLCANLGSHVPAYLQPRGWEAQCPNLFSHFTYGVRFNSVASCQSGRSAVENVDGVACDAGSDCNSGFCDRSQCTAANLQRGQFCVLHAQCTRGFCLPWLQCQ
jgi:hypothetical protein